MKISIENMYGINKIKNGIEFSTTKKNNIIYGYNAVGKTSFAKSLIHLVTNRQYERILEEDSKNPSIRLKFADINIIYDNEHKLDKKYDDRIFIFDKDYAKKNLRVDENTGGYPELGIRINERENLKDEIHKISLNVQKEIKNRLKKNFKSYAKSNFLDGALVGNISSTDITKVEDYIIKMNKKENLNIGNYVASDIMKESIDAYIKFEELAKEIKKETIKKIKDNIIKNEYKIHSIESKKFYESVLNYLENNILNNCPVCLKNEFNEAEIKEKIKYTLDNIVDENFKNKVTTISKKIEDTNTPLSNEIKHEIDSILSSTIELEDLKECIKKIENLKNNYDEILYAFIDINLDAEKQKILEDKNIIDEINKQNEKIATPTFIKQFDKMLQYIFKDNELKATVKKNKESNDCSIKLIFEKMENEDASIEKFYNEILSESQKTKMSLAFFFAIVLTNKTNKDILCVFDDPFDSYDSINKYELATIIYNFIEKKENFEKEEYYCNSIILTHSIDYLRLLKARLKLENNTSYFILTKNGIDILESQKIFIFDGDYEILKKMLLKDNVTINEILSIMVILRTLADYSSKCFKSEKNKLNVNNNMINKLFSYLSEKIIHGLFRNNLKVKDLVIELSKYTKKQKIVDYEKIENNLLKNQYKMIIEEANLEQKKLKFYDLLIIKNIISIYIRAGFDEILTRIIQFEGIDGELINKKKEKPVEIGEKLGIINKKIKKEEYNKIISLIKSNLTLLNDFGHSSNLFLTPMVDVPIEKLYDLLEQFKNIKYRGEKIGNLLDM